MLKDEYSFIVSLTDAYLYLNANITIHNGSYADTSDPNKVSLILKQLVFMLLSNTTDYNEVLNSIYKTLENNHYTKSYIQEICDNALSLISNKITSFIPQLSDDRCRGNYNFQLVRKDVIVITLNKKFLFNNDAA